MNKILVIDDEEWLREMVQMALEQKGYEVLQAEDGTLGIELARSEVPDLILCDVNMGKVDGYLTLSALRQEPVTAAIPFILMTGLADNAGMRHGMELGADDYLPKPFTLDALYAAVEARLRKARTVRELAEKRLADLRSNITLMLPHELRTPLNGMVVASDLLATDSANLTPQAVAELGRTILESSKRLERLIENFLIYAQIELLAADPQKVASLRESGGCQARPVVGEHARAQAEKADRAGDLELEIADCMPAISAENLGKVVDELVQNAFKFSPRESCVRVSLLPGEGGTAVLRVMDEGRGFSTEHITRIGAYMQFDRKLHEQQGLGLGLTIAKRLVEVHGGTVNIQKRDGARSTVTVKLPLGKAVGLPAAGNGRAVSSA